VRALPAPPSKRSEGSIRVRLLALLVTAMFAAACTSGGAGFTTAPQPNTPGAPPTTAATSAPPSASASGVAAASESTAPAASTAPSTVPSSVAASPSAVGTEALPPSFTAPPVSYPLTLTDDENNKVTLKAEPTRIVSITPATTEILFALGVGDRIVGNTDADDFPPEVKNLPHVATFNSVDVEKIVDLGVDLVIAGGNGFNKPDALAQLRRLGIPVLVVYAPDVRGVYHDFQLIAQAVNRVDGGNFLVASVRGEFDNIARRAAGLPKPRTFYELDATKEIYGPADGSFIVEMITLAGGTPITTGSPTVPGPVFAGELGVTPAANVGMPTPLIPVVSRTSPSVTKAAAPLFFIIPRRRSPMTAVSVKLSAFTTTTSPGRITSSVPKSARQSAGPVSQVSATPQNTVASLTGLIL